MHEYEVKTIDGKKRRVHVLLMEQALGRPLAGERRQVRISSEAEYVDLSALVSKTNAL